MNNMYFQFWGQDTVASNVSIAFSFVQYEEKIDANVCYST